MPDTCQGLVCCYASKHAQQEAPKMITIKNHMAESCNVALSCPIAALLGHNFVNRTLAMMQLPTMSSRPLADLLGWVYWLISSLPHFPQQDRVC